MIAGFVADLTAVLHLLDTGDKSGARMALDDIADAGHTLLIPATVFTQALIIADPTSDRVMWLYGFRACEVADHTGREAFNVAAQSRFADRPYEVHLHDAQTAYLAGARDWPILTADPARWTGYNHLDLVQL
ncbi:hypothetical protein [Microbispora sp. NPDC046933]|uniref:hypothetical protein n=1 Tax=Microbispora sp. NPDC046933 TaxID=3155618 RepID=UPI00340B4A75